MPEIFLSYTHEDAEAAARIEKSLRDLGVEVWIDNRLETGSRFTDHIHKQIDAAGAVIVCWSKKAMESPWVQAEALFALDRGKLTPVLIGKCELRPPFNAVNASDLTDWRGEARHAGWQRLLLALEKALDGVKLADQGLVEELRISGAAVATPEAARRRRMLRVAIIAGVALPALAAAAVVGYSQWKTRAEVDARISDDQERREEEEATRAQREAALSAWNTAKELDTREAVEAFIAQYPASTHVGEARQVLARIEARENLALSAAERAARALAAWQAAERANTIEGYENFKLAYAGSSLVRRADDAIAGLRRNADREAWDEAQRLNTVASYVAYKDGADRDLYPGRWRGEADQRIADLRLAENRADDERRWNAASRTTRSGRIAAFNAYIAWARQNGGRFIDDAVEARNLLQREEHLIGIARTERTSAAFRAYLSDFPQGEYRLEATQQRDMLAISEREEAEDVERFEDARRANTRVALHGYANRFDANYERRAQARELIRSLDNDDDSMWGRADRERDPQRRRERIQEYLRAYEADRHNRHVHEAERELARLDAPPTGGGTQTGGTQPTGTTPTGTTSGGGTQTGGSRPTGVTGVTTTGTGGTQTGGMQPAGTSSGGDSGAPPREPQAEDGESDPFGGRQREPD